MTVIDQRVVEMGFNNKQFESGVRESVKSLGTLKKSLELEASAKSLTNLANIGKTFSLANIANSVQGLTDRFSSMGIVGITILQNLTNAAINMGKRVLGVLITEPLRAGLSEYETQLNAIQTVLANTASKGTTLKDVNAALDQLNEYSDRTIYNFTEMARNIGTFTAAGLSLEVSVSAIKGIANLAAISGSNSQQASVAMYQLSQALASGTVRLMDWNSVVNAGMGGAVFQDALKETARLHGVAIDKMIKDEGSFRETLQKGWLTTQILTETLSKFTGDLTESQLKEMGYTQEQIEGIMKLGVSANDAATKVKTFSQLVGTLKEAAQSSWSMSWRLIIGDFEEARALYTNINNILSAMIEKSSDTRNLFLQQWKDAGGRTALIESLGRAFKYVMDIMSPFRHAFMTIFPPQNGKVLADLTIKFGEFIKKLMPSTKFLEQLFRISRGVFATFDVLGIVLGKVGGYLFGLVSKLMPTVKRVIEFMARIGDSLVAFRQAVRFDDLLGKTFRNIVGYIKPALSVIMEFVEKVKKIGLVLLEWKDKVKNFIIGLFPKEIDFGGFDNLSEKVNNRFSPVLKIFKGFGIVISNIWKAIIKMAPIFEKIGKAVAKVVGGIINAISESFKTLDFSNIFDVLNGGLIATILLAVKNFITNGSDAFGDVTDILGSVKGILDGVRTSIEAWQNNLNAKTLMTIAMAIGILTLSIIALALIDSEKLTKALTAITIMFGELVGSMSLMDKIPGGGSSKMTAIASQLVILSAALLIMTGAVSILAKLKPEQMTQGLVGIGVLLAMLMAFTKIVSTTSDKTLKGLGGLLLLVISLRMMVGVVERLGSLDVDTLRKGLITLATILTEIALFTKIASSSGTGLSQGAGFLLLAFSISILAKAVENMGKLSWEEIARGLVALAGSLVIITGAIKLMPKNMPIIALGLIGVSLALLIMSKALSTMGSMSWEEIARGMVALSGSLLVLSIGLKLMKNSLAGAASLIIVSTALAILAPALKLLGSMSLKEIGVGLLTLAGVFVILGLAGLVLGPLVPVILSLTTAMLLFGLGSLAIGAGLVLFSTGLMAIGVAGTTALGGITMLIMGLVGLIPMVVIKLVEGIVSFAVNITKAAPVLLSSLIQTLLVLVAGVVSVIPAVLSAIMQLITSILTTLVNNSPSFIQAGMDLLINLLKGIADNIGDVVKTAIDIVVNFIDGVASKLPDVIQSAFDLIISFVDGLTQGIEDNMPRLLESIGKLAGEIVKGLVTGLMAGIAEIVATVKEIGAAIITTLKDILGIHSPSAEAQDISSYVVQGLVNGFKKNMSKAEKVAEELGIGVLSVLSSVMNGDIEANPVIRPVVDLTDVKNGGQLLQNILSEGITIPANLINLTGMMNSGNNQNGSQINPTSQSTSIVFQQTNISPQPLSSVEIYRQTRNQLSLLRGLNNG